MEKEKLSYATIRFAEVWIPSAQLRFLNRIVNDFSTQLVGGQHLKKNDKILQQLYTSNLGNVEWRDIPTEKEL
jgi:hypothetical protein